MRNPKIILNYTSLSDADFEGKGTFILTSMTGNPHFPDPVPTLVEVQAAVTNYSDALNAAAGLGRNNVALKNKCRNELQGLLTQLGMYVMLVANGDVAILTSSGFTLAKVPEPAYITNPGNVTLSNGVTAGQLVSSVAAVLGARLYFHEICDAPPTDNTVWDRKQTSRARFVFTGLIPGKQYWVRVAVTGSGEQIAYSTVATQFVQ